MVQKKGLKINVANPCSENWQAMPQKGNGRLCSNCQNIVVDFSNLSDQELYNYFSKAGSIPCGRFHNDQLNKKILPLNNRKNVWGNFYKMTATLLAFISLKYAGASGNREKTNTIITPVFNKNKINITADKIIISGTVKDEHGHNIENAEVKFGDTIVTMTDKEGRFKIEITAKKDISPGLLIFSCPGLVSAVRSYHPAMLSTTYEVTLSAPSSFSGFTMGVAVSNLESMPPITIEFTNNDKTFSTQSKTALSKLAVWLRNNPETGINLMAYIKNDNIRNTAKKFQASVKKYLTEYEGISEERIKTEIQVISSIDKNILEVIGLGRD
jgi:hypothetical protein